MSDRRRSVTDADPWFCLPCALALDELFTAPRREDNPKLPPRCPNCNRSMAMTKQALRGHLASGASEGRDA